MSPRHRRRRRAATCSRSRPSTRTSWSWTSRSCATTSSRRCATSPTTSSARTRSTSRGRSPTAPPALQRRITEVCDEAYDAVAGGVERPHPLRPPRRRRTRAGIPALLAVAAGAPPPRARGHAPARGSRARVRRAARGAPLRDAHRLRRQRDQPVPAVRLDRRARRRGPRRRRRRTSTPRRRTSSRRSARACSRRSPRWGSRRRSPTAARRSSRPSAWRTTLIDRHFTGTASRIGGIGIDVLARETLDRHARAYPATHDDLLPVGGVYAWRRDGERHMWNPETVAALQHAVRGRQRRRAGQVRRVRAAGQRRREQAARRCAGS